MTDIWHFDISKFDIWVCFFFKLIFDIRRNPNQISLSKGYQKRSYPPITDFVGPCPHRDNNYRIRSNFWKFRLIRTGFRWGELVSLVKVFRPFRSERILLVFRGFFSVQSVETVGRYTTSYLLAGPACLWYLFDHQLLFKPKSSRFTKKRGGLNCVISPYCRSSFH